MAREGEAIHRMGADISMGMPHGPAITVKRGHLVFIAGSTATPVYHHHPHRPEQSENISPGLDDHTRIVMENLKRSLEAAGATLADVVEVTRSVTDLSDQDEMH